MSTDKSVTVVVVHGAFADASSFGALIGELQAEGVRVLAPPNPLRGLSADAAAIAEFCRSINGPILLAGHSYGGAVISQASAELDNVIGLVFLAAFAPDVGESVATVQEPFPHPKSGQAFRPTPYAAPGACDGPDIYIDRSLYHQVLCADITPEAACVAAATQRPIAYAATTEAASAAGWHSLPAWYLICTQDNAIAPEAQEFMAARMNATVDRLDSSHVPHLSRARTTAAFVTGALIAASQTVADQA